MHGRIWVESEQGKGSRFIVLLPRLSEQQYQQQLFLHKNREAQATIMGQANTAVAGAGMGGAVPSAGMGAPMAPVALNPETLAAQQQAAFAQVQNNTVPTQSGTQGQF